MSRPRDLGYALLGAAVAVVLAGVPLSPFIGGAVAAALRPGARDEGLRIGALAGVLTAVGLFVLSALGRAALPLPGIRADFTSFFLGAVVLFILMYVVVISAVGGFIGAGIRSAVDRRIVARR